MISEIHPALIRGPKIEAPRLWRFDKAADRYYFKMQDGKAVRGYLSVTSFVSKSLGIGDGLFQWATNVGKDYAEAYAGMRAAYGTLMHEVIVDIMRSGEGDFYQLADIGLNVALDLGYKYAAEDWANDLPKDVAAFLTFAQEKEFELMAAEIPVSSDRYGLAGCIDMVGSMKFGRGRVNCIVDLKSGRKGFYDEHRLQLHAYRIIWNDLFSELHDVTHVFNWAPNNWKKKPTYKLENQTDHLFKNTIRQRLAIAEGEGWIKPPTGYFQLEGKFSIDAFDINEHLKMVEI